MTERVTVVANSLEMLEAKQEIRDVLARYCRGIDRLDEALLRSCYHPDAIDNHGLYSGTIDEFLSHSLPRQRTLVLASHYLHSILIEIEGDAAVSEAYGRAVERVRLADGTVVDNTNGYRYVDRFERRGGGPWLIARRTVVIDWSRSDAVTEDWLADVELSRGRRDALDHIYVELAALRSGSESV